MKPINTPFRKSENIEKHGRLTQINDLRKNELNYFFISIISVFCIIVSVNHFLYVSSELKYQTSWLFSWIYLTLLVTPFLFFIKKSGRSLADFGITLQGWRTSLKNGSILSLLAMSTIILGFLVYSFITETRTIRSIFALGTISIVDIIFYLGHVLIQEFMIRGVIQSSLQRFLLDKSGHSSILSTSLIFGFIHIHNGYLLVLLTFLFSFPLGYLYLRHQNLIGVCLIHWTIGLLFLFFWNHIVY